MIMDSIARTRDRHGDPYDPVDKCDSTTYGAVSELKAVGDFSYPMWSLGSEPNDFFGVEHVV